MVGVSGSNADVSTAFLEIVPPISSAMPPTSSESATGWTTNMPLPE